MARPPRCFAFQIFIYIQYVRRKDSIGPNHFFIHFFFLLIAVEIKIHPGAGEADEDQVLRGGSGGMSFN